MTEAQAHAEHLKSLIDQARAKIASGMGVPSALWAKIEAVAKKMAEAL